MARERLHAAADVRGVDDEVRVARRGGEQFLGAGEGEFHSVKFIPVTEKRRAEVEAFVFTGA